MTHWRLARELIGAALSRPRETSTIAPVPLVALTGSLLLFLVAFPSPSGAQSTCPDGRISSVFIDNHSVFDLSDPDLSQRFDWAYRLANDLHVPTRERVIRRELLFREGECYDVERLRDSERLLRELAFIAEVDVFGVRQPDGSVHVIVDTQDEWSTRIEPRVGSGGSAAGLEGIRVREDNLFGTGHRIAAFYVDDEEEQVYGAEWFTPQLFGSRWDARLAAGRTPVGYLLSQAATYPFVGEVGRWGFRQSLEHEDHYFEYFVPGEEGLVAVWYPERRQSFELGVAHRWGTRGLNRTVLGVALAGEWRSYPGTPRFASEAGALVLGPEPPPVVRDSIASVRAVLMAGQRNLSYVRRRGLETVNGTEDVPLGVEVEVAVGPSLSGWADDRDLALDFGLYAAGEVAGSILAGAHVSVDARRSYDAPAARPEWADVFAELEAWSYWRPAPESRHTLVAAVTAVGGWHDRVPFQLTLGAETGLRGHADHVYPGGRRVVALLEHRTYLGWPAPDLVDLGGVAFLDIGKMWAGDAPFGVDSPVRADVGVGLRAAFPPGSRRTVRIDVGVPLTAGGLRDVRISIGMGQLLRRRIASRDPQLARSGGPDPVTSLFALPRP